MNNDLLMTIISIPCAVVLVVFFSALLIRKKEKPVKPVVKRYIYTKDTGNPFLDYHLEVLETKDGWVKYVHVTNCHRSTPTSIDLEWFNKNTVEIEETNNG